MRKCFLGLMLLGLFGCTTCEAQIVQLPTIRFFNVRTTVSVPDGGTMSLGGVSRNGRFSGNRGIPGFGTPFTRNRALGSFSQTAQANASTKLIIMSELEAEVLAEAKRRRLKSRAIDPNGTAAVQAKADFISRHIGRSRK